MRIDGFDGPVHSHGTDDYEAERSGFQAHGRHRPDLIAGATGPADVAAAIRFASREGLPVTAQATGHGVPMPAEHGLLVTTGRMAEVTVDPDTATARIGAGATWDDVVPRAAAHGLAPLTGSSPSVGAIGYTLGGGVGLLSRAFGFACDRVRRVELVDADGQLCDVTCDSDPQLFWALRGGRGNFGIVTAIEIDLLRLETIFGGGLFFDTAQTPRVLDTWAAWTTTVGDEMCSSIALMPVPDHSAFPEPLRGKHVAHIRVAFAGDAAQGERWVAPLRALGEPLIDSLGQLPYSSSATIHNEPPGPMSFYSEHMLAERIPPEATAALWGTVGPDAAFPSIVEIRHLGGAMSRPAAVPGAVPRRDGYLIGVLSHPGDDPGVYPATRKAMAPWVNGGLIQNFLYGAFATPDNVRRAFAPADYDRLRALKAARDPGDLFSLGHHIPAG